MESHNSVLNHVNLQCTGINTGVFTTGALEVLQSCVLLQVCLTAVSAVPCKLTLITLAWFLTL